MSIGIVDVDAQQNAGVPVAGFVTAMHNFLRTRVDDYLTDHTEACQKALDFLLLSSIAVPAHRG